MSTKIIDQIILPRVAEQDMPPVDVIEEDFKTYFYITRKGMDFHRTNDAWRPFDHDGILRPGWSLDLA